MPITLQGAGTMVGSAASVVASPLTAINPATRLLILLIKTCNQPVTPTVNTGGTGTWNLLVTRAIGVANTATGHLLQIYWKYGSNTNAASDQALIPDSGDHQIAIITGWDGVEVTPRPFVVAGAGQRTTNGTALTILGNTGTTVNNCAFLVFGCGSSPTVSTNAATAFANTTQGVAGTLVEIFDKGFALNFGGSLFGAWCTQALAGSPGNSTITITPTQMGVGFSFYIYPAGTGTLPVTKANLPATGGLTFSGAAVTGKNLVSGGIARAKRFFDWL